MNKTTTTLTPSQSHHLFFILSTYSNLTHHPNYQHHPKLTPELSQLRENLPFPYTHFNLLSISPSNLTLLHYIFNDYLTSNHNYHGVPFFTKTQLSTHQTIFRKLSKLTS